MTPQAILDAAIGEAGVRRLENESFREGLTELTNSVARCPLPHAAGRENLWRVMIGALCARLKAERYFVEHPAIAQLAIERPVFVCGIPRTGTTLVLNLLGQDPGRRTILKWEPNHSVPPATTATLRTDPRCVAQLETERRAVLEGKLQTHIHFEWADSTTECVFVHRQDFKSAGWDALLPMPAYSEFFLGCDMRATYAWHKRFLQILHSTAPGRWTLKAPSHALFMDAIMAVYPDARFVWTHRDPLTAVASLASLLADVHRRFADRADIGWIRDYAPRQASEHVRRAMDFSRRHPGRVFDLYYEALTRDPLAQMRRLYAWLGDDLSDAAHDRMALWVKQNPQGHLGAHVYRLADFDLEPAALQALFADYLAQHPAIMQHAGHCARYAESAPEQLLS